MEINRDFVMQLTLMADAAFQIAFRGNLEGSERLARMVLRRDDIRIISADTQRKLQSIEGHSVELDLLAEDAEGRQIDIEIQGEAGNREELLLRALYYLSSLHVSSLGKRRPYRDMRESYVAFLVDGDVFGDGKAMHEIRLKDEEGREIEEYRSAIVIADVRYRGRMETEWDRLCHDIHESDMERMELGWMREALYRVKGDDNMIDTTVSLIKKVRDEGWENGLKEGRREGREEGILKGRHEVARSMIADGSIPLQKIAEFSGLPLGEVESIRNSMHAG